MNETPNNNQNNQQLVTGSNIMSYSPEAMQEKRMSIAALIEKINANNVVGEIVDDYEKERSQTVAKQKEQVQKEQLEKEAQIRQELEEQRLLEEEQARQAEEEKPKFSTFVSSLAQKTKEEILNSGLTKKISKKDEILEEQDEDEEAVTSPKISLKASIALALDKIKDRPKKAKAPKKTRPASKKEAPKQKQGAKKVSITYADDFVDEFTEEVETEVVEKPRKTPEEIKTEFEKKRDALRNDIIRTHESTSIDEVYRFRCALERLSEDSYNYTYVYAACIIDKDFESVSIIRNVTMLAELIEESGDSLDFYFAYIVTNKGVQHFGCDEALSDVTLAMEDVRNLFLQKKGKVSPEHIQTLNSLRIFKTIYYEDSMSRMRR